MVTHPPGIILFLTREAHTAKRVAPEIHLVLRYLAVNASLGVWTVPVASTVNLEFRGMGCAVLRAFLWSRFARW